MKITRIVGTLSCALALAACNDVSHVSRTPNTTDQAADSASKATVAAQQETQRSSSMLPEAVPVPPASTSPVVTGEVEEPKTSTETPVTMAKADTAVPESATTDASAGSAASQTPGTASATSQTPSSAPAMSEMAGSASAMREATPPSSAQEQPNGGTDNAATKPLSPLSQDEQSQSMPMALHGNNHSSPSVEQRATN